MVTLLRTLTMKSKWSYTQKYQGWSVEEILKTHPSTIYYVYCYKREITFNEEVLNVFETMFKEFKRIDKPNIDTEQFQRQFQNLWSNKSYIELKNIITSLKMDNKSVPVGLLEEFDKKRMVRNDKKFFKVTYSKEELRSMNLRRSIY